MKVIDVLQKIANDEDIPKKIKFDNQIFEYREEMLDYYCYDYDLNLMGYQKILNEEIEIIEEPKKIENIDFDIDFPDRDINIGELYDKLNEVIDYINDKEKNERYI